MTMILYTLTDIVISNSQKNFEQHLLHNCCATGAFVKMDIHFLQIFGLQSISQILNVIKVS